MAEEWCQLIGMSRNRKIGEHTLMWALNWMNF